MSETSYEREEFDRTKRAFQFALDDFWKALSGPVRYFEPFELAEYRKAEASLKLAWEDFGEAAAGPLEYYELGCAIETERNELKDKLSTAEVQNEAMHTGLVDIAYNLPDKTAEELREIAYKTLDLLTK